MLKKYFDNIKDTIKIILESSQEIDGMILILPIVGRVATENVCIELFLPSYTQLENYKTSSLKPINEIRYSYLRTLPATYIGLIFKKEVAYLASIFPDVQTTFILNQATYPLVYICCPAINSNPIHWSSFHTRLPKIIESIILLEE